MTGHSKKIYIDKVEQTQLEEAFQLIWNAFLEFVAPDYTNEGIDNFYNEYIVGMNFRERFINRKEIMYGAYIDGKLTGVLSISEKNTVSCVFVDGKYHRMGVGKKMFDMVIEELREKGIEKIKLNASPYAVPFYHYIGFKDTGVQAMYKGIVYTPMELSI